MKKRKGWIVILVIFLIAFSFEFKGITQKYFKDFYTPNLEEEIKLECAKLPKDEQNEYNLNQCFHNLKNWSIIVGVICPAFIALVFTIFKYIFLWIVLFSIYFSNKKYDDTKLSSIDFDNNNEYYRDILNKYPVDLLGFIDHVQFNYPDVLIAMLLQLQMRGVLNLDNNTIYLNNNIDLNNLSNNEKYLINNIRNNKLVINNIAEYELLVVNDGISKGLLEKKNIDKKFLFRKFANSIFMYLIILITFILYLNFGPNSFNINNLLLSFVVMLFFILTPIFIFIYPIYLSLKIRAYYNKIKNNPYFRSKKAEEINKKLEGLKNYLKDFSVLDKREAKEIMLWDEYLIYSVLFGHNNKIIDEYKDLIVIYSYQQNC